MLKYLNIIEWKLRYPVILNKKKPVQLLKKLKLLIVSDTLVSLEDFFIQDVIRSMHLSSTEVYIITIDQINSIIVPKERIVGYWWIGVQALLNYNHYSLSTPSLLTLKVNSNEKRNLWNQINSFFKKKY